MDQNPYNTEDKPVDISGALSRLGHVLYTPQGGDPRTLAKVELGRMGGDLDAAKSVGHALLAKSAAGYEAMGSPLGSNEHVDETAALLGPKSISPEGQSSVQRLMDNLGSVGKATGISDLAHSLSSKYNAMQGAAEPLIQKYAGIPAAAAAHAAFETAPQAAIPGLGEERAAAGAAADVARTLGPSDRIRQVAADYMKSAGLPHVPPGAPLKVDPNRASAIAQAFDAMPHAPNDPKVAASYDAMIKETMAQYQAMKASGFRAEFMPQGQNPYPKISDTLHDIQQNNHMFVFPTESGFGSGDLGGNPLLQQSGESFNGVPATNNDIFRAVHDYFGHAKEGNTFRANGEETAWANHAAMYSPAARPAMTTETRGQNSWVNFGPHGEANRTTSGADTVYAPQKIGLLPDEFSQAPPSPYDILAQYHADNGGSTYHPGTSNIPDTGYSVSLHPGRATVMGTPPTGRNLSDYVQANQDAFDKDPGAHLGTWHDKDDSGMHYLDVSHVDPNLDSAMEKAKGANQKAIFDLGGKQEIPNPHYDPTTDTQGAPQDDNPLAAVSPLRFTATDPGRVHLNSLPEALEREGEAARRDAADRPPPEPILDLNGPLPPPNASYIGSQAFAEGGEVGVLGDALATAARLPTPAALKAKYADNPQAIQNFHDWAKNTAVSYTNGEPIPVYHNTDALNDFSAFRPYRGDIGSHFGTKGQANMRGAAVQGRVPPAVEESSRTTGDLNPVPKNQVSGQRTIPAYLSIQNPLRTPDLGEWGHDQLKQYLLGEGEHGADENAMYPAEAAGIDPKAVAATQNNHQLRKVLQDHGYDGIVYANNGEPDMPPAIQLARQDAEQKRQAFLQDPANKPYWDTVTGANTASRGAGDMDAAAAQFPEQHAQYQALAGQYHLADEAYRRFMHSAGDNPADSYVAFDPSQVKSAVGNTGEFDPGTQDINHAAGGEVRSYADGGGVEGAGLIGDAIQQVSHLPLTATAAEAAPLAEHVAQYGGATYSPSTGALHRSGSVTSDPESTVALDHAPDPDEIHDFMMQNQHVLGEDPQAVLHITSDDNGNHFIRTGTHAPEMPQDPESMEPSELIDKYLQSGLSSKHPMASEADYSARPSTPWTAGQQTVVNPKRNAFPGVYGDPRQVIADAAAKVGPEDPLMQRLFGVSRADLSDLSLSRQGNELGVLPGEKQNPQGAASARDVMTPQNEQRLIDVLGEARKAPGLYQGMTGWYAMDPLFQHFVKEFGPDEAIARYKQFNTLSGMASPGSDVGSEIARGSTANALHTQGRFNDFVRYGGGVEDSGSSGRPADMADLPGHVYHRSQALPMQQYLESGEMQMKSPKVPMYIAASGVPETGFQTSTPVGDAHWARAVGLADTRNMRTLKGQEIVPGSSVSTPEMQTLAPWWRDRVAGPAGLESVPAQALAWGAFSPQTGVKSAIGAPKLEILSTQIGKLADRLGISPEEARDRVVRGEAGAFSAGGVV
jgi:hypothetical protein